MNEGLEMDPNPSSFLPLIFVLHNSTNLSSTICFTIVLPYGLVSYHPLLTQPTTLLSYFLTSVHSVHCLGCLLFVLGSAGSA